MSHIPDELASADDAHAITDALLRLSAGTDDGDALVFASAFAAQSVVDFGRCGRKLDPAFEPLRGRSMIIGFLVGTSTLRLTSHIVTSARTRTADNRAELLALVDARHIVRAEPDRRFRTMNWYTAELELHESAWRIDHLTIDDIWSEGDPRIMLQRQEAAR